MAFCVIKQPKKLAALILLYLGCLTSAATPSQAEPRLKLDWKYQINPATVAEMAQVTWFQCPCFRWVVTGRALSGKIESKEFLISSEGLARLRMDHVFDMREFQVATFNSGQFDFLWKTGHIGVGSNGGTWGNDLDRGATEIRRGEFHFLANALLNDKLRLDLRTGLEVDKQKINAIEVGRMMVTELATFTWEKNGWSGTVSGYAGQNLDHFDSKDYVRAGVTNYVGYTFDIHDFLLGLGLNLAYDYDGWRKFMASMPGLFTAGFQVSFSYAVTETPRRHTIIPWARQ